MENNLESLKRELPRQFTGPFHDHQNPAYYEAKGWNEAIDAVIASTGRLTLPPAADGDDITEKNQTEMPERIWLYGRDGNFDRASVEQVSTYQVQYIRVADSAGMGWLPIDDRAKNGQRILVRYSTRGKSPQRSDIQIVWRGQHPDWGDSWLRNEGKDIICDDAVHDYIPLKALQRPATSNVSSEDLEHTKECFDIACMDDHVTDCLDDCAIKTIRALLAERAGGV